MNMLVGSLTFLPLLAAALAHLLWSLGSTWPIRNEQLLVQTVVGTPGATRMPNRLVIFVVALLILAAGLVALSISDHDSGGLLWTLIGAVLAIVFLGRGLAGYTPGWRARHSGEPFATLDRKTYSPLCLWVGVGFVLLVAMRLM
ncbi:MAG TPA: DUF3995 domain-containing protein [Devosia sp.]|jgi:hypothetical protein|nr:DUF3995 domain-containing protein [Devosia sp.]